MKHSPPPTDGVAVLLIDMQVLFLQDLHPWIRARLIRSQLKVLKECAKKDIPVVCLEYEGYGPTHPSLLEALEKVPRTEFIRKDCNSGFRRTNLEQILKERFMSTTLVLMGVNASFCVLETAISARRKGFKLATAKDLIDNATYHFWLFCHHRWFRKNGQLYGGSGALLQRVLA